LFPGYTESRTEAWGWG